MRTFRGNALADFGRVLHQCRSKGEGARRPGVVDCAADADRSQILGGIDAHFRDADGRFLHEEDIVPKPALDAGVVPVGAVGTREGRDAVLRRGSEVGEDPHGDEVVTRFQEMRDFHFARDEVAEVSPGEGAVNEDFGLRANLLEAQEAAFAVGRGRYVKVTPVIAPEIDLLRIEDLRVVEASIRPPVERHGDFRPARVVGLRRKEVTFSVGGGTKRGGLAVESIELPCSGERCTGCALYRKANDIRQRT